MEVKQIKAWLAPTAGTQHETESAALEAECRALIEPALAEVDDVLDTCIETKVPAYEFAVEFVRQLHRQGVLEYVMGASRAAKPE